MSGLGCNKKLEVGKRNTLSFKDSIRKRCQNGSVESYINLRFSNTKPMIPKIVNGSSGIEKNNMKTGKNPLKNE